MKTTLRQIDRALQDVAQNHVQVNDYFWGDWTDSYEGRNQSYPAIVCNVETPANFSKITRITLNIICVDQVARDQSNLKDVESDTLQILHDFFRIMKHSPNWKEFCVVESATPDLKFKDASPEEVAGWRLKMVIKLIESEGLCDIPVGDYDTNKKIKC